MHFKNGIHKTIYQHLPGPKASFEASSHFCRCIGCHTRARLGPNLGTQ